MGTLHILRNFDTDLCLETLDAPAGDSLLLIQDAVLNRQTFPCPVAVCQDDLTARNVQSHHPALTYDAIRDLMLRHDRVLLW